MTVPRRKRLSRQARLRSARKWIPTYSGRDLVRGYRKWIGVSRVCAIVELRLLGVDIPDSRLEDAQRDERDRAALRARRRSSRRTPPAGSDSEFAFIAGYTEGGAPFGITWEEMGRSEIEESDEDDRIRGTDGEQHAEIRPRRRARAPGRSPRAISSSASPWRRSIRRSGVSCGCRAEPDARRRLGRDLRAGSALSGTCALRPLSSPPHLR